MVAVCLKHVKEGLKSLDVPHVAKLNYKQGESTTYKCTFCHLIADYKFFNERPYRKKKEFNEV